MKTKKNFIYQILPRLFGNTQPNNQPNGTIEENGSGKFNDISDKALRAISNNGYTHIWLIGVLAHSSTTDYTAYGIPKEYPEIIKGKAGSPYAIRDYYDVDPDLAVNVAERMREFEELISRIHENGLKVIIDFVPNHLSRNYKSISKPHGMPDFGENDDTSVAFSPMNNFYYIPGEALDIQFSNKKDTQETFVENPAKVTGNDCFTSKPAQYDWYETVKLNYGVDYLNGHAKYFTKIPDTWKKMKEILLFWAQKQVDGFRCDMAEMVPVEFWRWVIPQVRHNYPRMMFIGELYNPNEYRNYLDEEVFDYLYDKVGVYDMLRDVACGYRPASDLSFALNAVGDIQDKMLNFLENHDEQRVASDYFLKSGEKARAAMVFTACLNTNPVMIFFGQEFGERGMDEEGFSGKNGRTSIFDYWTINTVSRWNNNGKWNDKLLTENEIELRDFYAKLLNVCHKEKALAQGGFYDLMSANYGNPDFNSARQFAYLRSDKKDILLVLANFDSQEVEVAVYIPEHAFHFFDVRVSDNCVAFPLLTRKKEKINFSHKQPFKTKIAAHSGEIFKISCL